MNGSAQQRIYRRARGRGLLTFLALGSLVASLQAQTDVATPPSGFITLAIKGTGGTNSSALTFLGLGLTRPVEFQGKVDLIAAYGANTLTSTQANWTSNQFNGTNGAYFLEIASTNSPYAGLMTDIVQTGTNTLTTADNLSAVLQTNDIYRVRKHWTPASLFGTNNEAGLGAGNSLTADEILIYDALSGLYTTYYYSTGGLFSTPGWRLSGGDPSVDQSSAKLRLTQGILVRRKQIGDLNLKLYGAVKLGYTALMVRTGLNILGNVYPTSTLTLGSSGLYTGNPATGLADGNLVTADQVLLYDGVYRAYYYLTNGLFGGAGWRSTDDVNSDASNTVIPPGSSLLIQRLSPRAGFLWYVPQPF